MIGQTDPLVGKTIGQHYVIDAFLGEGAMARVYRAHHALLANKQFAVKVMLGDLAAQLEMRLRFAQEAEAASQLDHPNVVSAVDFGRSETGLLFMVMQLIEGRSLATIIAQEGALSPRRVLVIARQICRGLAHAHERGLVHRDLKPENVVISGDDQVRLIDFGLAITADTRRSMRLTAPGLAMGTPLYAAPEQTHGEPVDHRADLFALGVTVFEMLAGRPPFEGGLVEILRQNASDRMPTIPPRANPFVPRSLLEIVRTLMRREPKDRYPDASTTLAALEAVQLAPLTDAASRVTRNGARIGIAIAALGALAIAGRFTLRSQEAQASGPEEPPPPLMLASAPAAPLPPSADSILIDASTGHILPSADAEVRIEGLRVRGLAAPAVRRAIAQLLPQTRICYARAAHEVATISQARVRVALAIDGRSAVRAKARGDGMPTLADCVAETMSSLRFQPVSKQGAAVMVELGFTPVAF